LHQHDYKEIQELQCCFYVEVFLKKKKEKMDRIKVEPDSQEESSLATHNEDNFIHIKEEYVPEEPFSSQDPENVSLK